MAAININSVRFNELLQADKPVLVEFWAPWCVFCRRIDAAYNKVAEQYGDKLEVVKINIDEEPELSDREQIEVVPSLLLYKGGQVVNSIVAPESKAMIDRFINDSLE